MILLYYNNIFNIFLSSRNDQFNGVTTASADVPDCTVGSSIRCEGLASTSRERRYGSDNSQPH